MDERTVKEEVANYLETELSLQDNFSFRVKVGEIGVPGYENKWYCDILVYVNGHPTLAVECKGSNNSVRDAIGQAHTYRYSGLRAAVAGYSVDEEMLEVVRQAHITCFNVTNKRVHEIQPIPKDKLSGLSDSQRKRYEDRIKILEGKVEILQERLDKL